MTITNGYTTLTTMQSELGTSAAADAPRIERSVEAASRQIDGWCGRRFWIDGSVVTREFHADSPTCCYVDDIATTTGLVVKIDEAATGAFGTTVTIGTDFVLYPLNAADMVPVWPYTEIRLADNYGFPLLGNGRPGVQVTAKFGWSAVPDDVEKACIVQAIDLFKSKDAAFGIAGLNDFGPLRVQSSINRIAQALLAPYRIIGVG